MDEFFLGSAAVLLLISILLLTRLLKVKKFSEKQPQLQGFPPKGSYSAFL